MTCGNSRVYVGDIGTEIFVDTCSDLALATVTNLVVRKPNGTLATWMGGIYGAGNTQIRYVLRAGDVDQAGPYSLHAAVTMPSGVWTGNLTSFVAYERFVA